MALAAAMSIFGGQAHGSATPTYTPPPATITIVDNAAGSTDFNAYPGNSASTDADIGNSISGGAGSWKKTNLTTTAAYGTSSLSGTSQRICTYTPSATAPWPGTDIHYYRVYIGGVESFGAPVNIQFKSSQTITFPAIANQVYGAAPITLAATSARTLAPTGGQSAPAQPAITYAVTGPATISGSVLTITGVGTITVTASQAGDTNYSAATDVVRSFAVSKAPLTVTASNASRAYGAANPTFTATYTGLVNGETFATSGITGAPSLTTTATSTTPVGTAAITCALGTLASSNYTFSGFVNGTLTIAKAAVTVTAVDASRAYGAANPVFTASYSGFANGETFATSGATGAPSLTTTATGSTPVGTAVITAAVGTLAASNYSFSTFVNGTLTITKAGLTVTASNASRAYGAANPTFSASYSGFVNGETFATSGATGAPSLTTTATGTTPVGTAAITAAVGTLAASNYSFSTFVNGTLTITQAAVTVTANNASRAYGAANPAFGASYSGFANGETFATSGATGAPSLTTTATGTTPVGTAVITTAIGTLASGNYTFSTFANGTLTITQAAVTVTAVDASRAYGAANPTFGASYSGFANGETFATSGATGAPSLTTTATGTTPVGTAAITAAIGTLAASNYSFSTFVNGTLTITKAAVTVTANNASRAYGAANPTFTVSYSGFANGETFATSGATGAPSLTTTATGTTPVGTAAITAAIGTLASGNYAFSTFVNGTLTITKTAVTVTAVDASRAYGAANPTFTASYSGFANGETFATSGATGAPSLTTTATGTTPVGTAAITAAIGTLTSGNYTFSTFVNGTLTITQAAVTVTAVDASRAYGAANPTFTASYGGFANGETFATSGATGAPSLTTTATGATPVGTATIAAAIGTLASGNYTFSSFVNGTLTITKAVVTVTADNASRAYGAANPTFTASYSGFANGETFATSGATGAPSLSTTATASTPVGAAPIAAALGTLASANYGFAFVDGVLSITKAALTVTADNASRPFGSANPAFTASYSGFVNGETLATSDVTGAPSLTSSATPASPVGTAPITAAIGTLASANYSLLLVDGVLTIDKAVLTITADNASRAYGAANPTFTATYSGFVNGQTLATSDVTGVPALSTTATASTPVGAVPIVAAIGTLASPSYQFVFVNGVLSIGKVTLTVTANDCARVYGGANPAFTASYSGFVNGETLATSDITGAPSLTTTATTASPAGTAAITAAIGTLSSSTYDFAFVDGTMTIGKATAAVVANDASRAYGAANPVFTAAIQGFVNGESLATSGITGSAAVTSGATASTPAGSAVITAAIGTLAAANYDFTFSAGVLTITKAPLTVTADDASRTYGAANPAFTASYAGFVNGEVLATSGLTGQPSLTTTATASTPAGSAVITAAAGTLASSNYDIVFANGTLTIGKATLTVAADPASRAYGAANPAFTASYGGFANGETISSSGVTGTPSLSTTATGATPVGTAVITAGLGSLASANYSFAFVNGTLTIGKAMLTVTANNASRAYGAANPTFTASYAGFVNGETLATSGVAGAPSLTTAATATTPVGTASITASVGSLTAANYAFILVGGTLSITPAVLTVTADPASRMYGSANPAFTASYSGFLNGDSMASGAVTGSPSLTTSATATTPVGAAVIVAGAGSLAATNYAFAFVDGTLSITQATLTVAAVDAARAYGAANPAFSATYSGFVNGQTLATSGVTGSPSLSTAATAATPAGTSPITAGLGSLSSGNYTFAFVAGTLTITPATLTVTADPASRPYGAANPAFSASYSGFVNGETLATSGVAGSPSLTTAAVAGTPVGSIAITAALGSLSSANYSFAFAPGSLSITPVSLQVTANDASMIRGGPLPSFSASYIGFVAGDTVSSLGGTLTFSTPATSSSPYGAYPVTPSGYSSANYVISYVDGVLNIRGSTATATPVKDTTTFGDWTFAYGADGYSIIQGPAAQPSYGAVTPTFGQQPWVISATKGGVGGLELPAGGRIEAYDDSYTSMTYDVSLLGGTHQMALYFADYEGVHRSQLVELVDNATGSVLSSTTLSEFRDGVYLIYQVSGSFEIRVTVLSGVNAVMSGIFFGGSQQSFATGQATFVETDAVTQGDWTHRFGADGYTLFGDTYAYPSYAHPLDRALTNTWAASTSEVRALERVGGGRVASCCEGFSTFTLGVNVSGGPKRMAIYCLDWERVNRAQTIEILDGLTGAVLDTRSASNFGDGLYLVYNVQGYVKLRITSSAPASAVASGIFFGGQRATPAAGTVTYITTDTQTQGDWTMRYGQDGYDLFGSTAAYPAYASASQHGCWPIVWQASSTATRALEMIAGGREAGALEGYTPYTVDLTLSGGTHRVAVYCLDWEKVNRVETIEVLDGQTDAILDTRTMSSFGDGVYLVYDLTGHVKLRVTPTAGPNAEISGIFFGAPRLPAQPGTAVYLHSNTTAAGNWTALYGFEGDSIPTIAPTYPTYATKVSERGDVETWAASTTDPRGTEVTGGRTATDWSSSTSFSQYLNLGASQHNIALYFVDWEKVNRSQTVEIIDATTGTVLDTRPLTGFGGGTYLVYQVSGFIQVRITNAGGPNAVLSGVFYGVIPGAGG